MNKKVQAFKAEAALVRAAIDPNAVMDSIRDTLKRGCVLIRSDFKNLTSKGVATKKGNITSFVVKEGKFVAAGVELPIKVIGDIFVEEEDLSDPSRTPKQIRLTPEQVVRKLIEDIGIPNYRVDEGGEWERDGVSIGAVRKFPPVGHKELTGTIKPYTAISSDARSVSLWVVVTVELKNVYSYFQHVNQDRAISESGALNGLRQFVNLWVKQGDLKV